METRYRELDPSLFESADIDVYEGERIAGPPVGFWRDAWIRLKKNRGALISLAVLVSVFATAFVIGPLISSQSPYTQDLAQRYLGPTSEFWFGTDKFGRDMWTRVWPGRRRPAARDRDPERCPLLSDRHTCDGRPRPWDHNHHHCACCDRLDVHGENRAWQDAATEKPGVYPRLALSRGKRVQACMEAPDP